MTSIVQLLLAAGGQQVPVIDWDWTILVQAAIFLVAFAFMRKLVFLPYLDARRKRRDETEGIREKSKEIEMESEKIAQDLKEQLRLARQDASAARASILAEGEKRAKELLAAVRSGTAEELSASVREVSALVPKLERELQEKSEDFARDIVSKVLGRGESGRSD